MFLNYAACARLFLMKLPADHIRFPPPLWNKAFFFTSLKPKQKVFSKNAFRFTFFQQGLHSRRGHLPVPAAAAGRGLPRPHVQVRVSHAGRVQPRAPRVQADHVAAVHGRRHARVRAVHHRQRRAAHPDRPVPVALLRDHPRASARESFENDNFIFELVCSEIY